MAPLVSCQEIGQSHGPRELFSGLSVALQKGDQVGLIGPNGAGKTTLLKLLAGIDRPDSGVIRTASGTRVAFVPQHVVDFEGTVEEAVMAVAEGEEHEAYSRVRKILGSLRFDDPTKKAGELSGGWKRRLAMARALVQEPDVLLLDEPTNHLDIESILWLEGFLRRERITFVLTSHDRVFLDNVCNKTWEVSHRYPGGIFTVEAPYADFVERRQIFLEGQSKYEAGLRSKMRREAEWLRQTPKARTTKSRSRIQEAARIEHELARVKFRNKEAKARVQLSATGRQTKKLCAAKNLSKTLGGRNLFEKVDLTLNRGDRFGIVGENGSGKSTLLRILAGEIESDSGTVKYADDLKIFYFDQHREQLDLTQTLLRGLAPTGDRVQFQGRSLHVNSWAERLLFRKDQLDLPMQYLSGGERARVVIGRLMTRPADLLLLDEPTNDLDIQTLELLEQSLDDFPGAVVLVTHDRAMMDRVSDRLLAVGESSQGQNFNDTDAWLSWRLQLKKASQAPKTKPRPKKSAGLTYKEQRELAALEKKIGELEFTVTKLTKESESAEELELQRVCDLLGKAHTDLEKAYKRWEELEGKK